MFDGLPNYTWGKCLEIFSRFSTPPDYVKQGNSKFAGLGQTMVSLVEQLRDDPEIPELNRIISHITLRLWYPDISSIEVHITPIEKDILWIGINQFEEVSVPLEIAVKTVKHFLKMAREKVEKLKEIPDKDETGDIEGEFKSLPLAWLQSSALDRIFNISVNHSYYELHLDELSKMPPEKLRQLVVDMAEIRKLISQTRNISREKRTQAWLEELEKDND